MSNWIIILAPLVICLLVRLVVYSRSQITSYSENKTVVLELIAPVLFHINLWILYQLNPFMPHKTHIEDNKSKKIYSGRQRR